ncbi:MAG: hypothetical protein HC902_04870 [Calothrix sp. SM1_5_4]|nr:hypothetical protein [Calothrix sp. SM1_5_4]
MIPLYESADFTGSLAGGVRYLDLENSANTGSQSEVANLIGPALGLRLRFYKFFIGYEYGIMSARHYAVGTIANVLKYNLALTTLDGGIRIPFNQLTVSISYSRSTGVVPADKTGLSSGAPYSDQIYWLQFTYSTGASFQKFLQYLF